LNLEKNKQNIQNIKESQGKSGSFFFFTYDKKFIIKTLEEAEKITLLGDFLKKYYEHIQEGNSLITRIYGVYEVLIQ